MSVARKPVPDLYGTDFAAWLERQGGLLRARRVADLDLDNIAEEIETLGRAERQGLTSQMTRLLLHLLKWTVQPERRSKSWRLSIINSRDEIDDVLSGSPSLRREMPEIAAKAYARARSQAAVEMDADLAQLPAALPFSLEQALDPDFMPD